MNTRVSFFVILLLGMISAHAGPSIEAQLADMWKQSKYTELGIFLDSKASVNPPDVVALYCSKVFYLFIHPDKSRALAAARKLKGVASETGDVGFIAFVDGEIAEIQSIPDVQFTQGTAEVLQVFHTEFPDQFPNVEIGVRLRKFKKQ
ncbi:MAG TPA: hypothetical protein VGO11_09065 [Chthoniobacteraceae bacterium]|jgi:hypothetical protein|nr:hypothetical protein [Chthoniobacteraceae bacterium]